MSSAICFNLDQSKILSSGNGLINLCSLDYHDLRIFLERELLGKVPLLGEIQYAIKKKSSKLKAAVNFKLKVVQMMISVFQRVQNVGKEKNAGYQHFLLFPHYFQKPFSAYSVKL